MLFKQYPIVTNRSLEWHMNMHPLALRAPRLFAAVSALAIMLAHESNALAESDSARIRKLEKKLEYSVKLIEELQTQVKQLEQTASKAPGTKDAQQLNDALASQNARIEGVEQQVSQINTGLGTRGSTETGLSLHGFADAGASWSGLGNPKGFTAGSLDFYLTPQFSDNVRALIEALIDFDMSGNSGIGLERIQLGYTFSDQATVWMGRFHTPYGYFNTAFHHGKQIQTSITRPRFLDFEDHGGILPAHTVGLWGTGAFKSGGGGKLTYDAFLGNSPSIVGNSLNMNNLGSRNHSVSAGGNLGYYFPGSWNGLKVGAHLLKGRIQDDANPANITDLNILGGYAFYDDDNWEGFAEYYQFNNKNVVDNTGAGLGFHTSRAGFIQLGRRFSAWTPYARLEKAVLDQANNYFNQLNSGRSYARQALGLRYDVNPKAAVTLEMNHTEQTNAPLQDFNEARLQYAIRF